MDVAEKAAVMSMKRTEIEAIRAGVNTAIP
jgi:hypothetical protein